MACGGESTTEDASIPVQKHNVHRREIFRNENVNAVGEDYFDCVFYNCQIEMNHSTIEGCKFIGGDIIVVDWCEDVAILNNYFSNPDSPIRRGPAVKVGWDKRDV